jgi:hypothetical protein
MRKVRRGILVAIAAGVLSVAGVPFAVAAQPGPGDKQCIPGKQGNPHPAHKAGVCPNP